MSVSLKSQRKLQRRGSEAEYLQIMTVNNALEGRRATLRTSRWSQLPQRDMEVRCNDLRFTSWTGRDD